MAIQHEQLNQYDVHVGHWHALVAGRDSADAIECARRRMYEDMPRLWDMITKLSVDRFHVVALS